MKHNLTFIDKNFKTICFNKNDTSQLTKSKLAYIKTLKSILMHLFMIFYGLRCGGTLIILKPGMPAQELGKHLSVGHKLYDNVTKDLHQLQHEHHQYTQ